MIVDLPGSLEAALKVRANAHGISAEGYLCQVLERVLGPDLQVQTSGAPFETGRGSFAKYGQPPSSEEIAANRSEMFRSFGEDF